MTYRKLEKAKKKLRRLCEYRNLQNVELILFCDEDVRTEVDGVVIMPLREVYDKFVRTDAGKAWQKDISNINGAGKNSMM